MSVVSAIIVGQGEKRQTEQGVLAAFAAVSVGAPTPIRLRHPGVREIT